MKYLNFSTLIFILIFIACHQKPNHDPDPNPGVESFSFNSLTVDGRFAGFDYRGLSTLPITKVSFTSPVMQSSAESAVQLFDSQSKRVSVVLQYEKSDSVLVIRPLTPLQNISKYNLKISTALKSKSGGTLLSPVEVNLSTAIDSSAKFPAISADSLLTRIQQQTFRYFWNFGHPVSGLARERNSSGDVVTIGGSGFGIMALPVAIERRFITREEGLARLELIVNFLQNHADRYHGAFPHWLNGSTGKTQPFSAKDNGADLVETSFLIMGLLSARQYFDGSSAAEIALRTQIDQIWHSVEWDFFRKNGSNQLYWHWSPDYQWEMNLPVSGWNEAMIVYVLAASSPTHAIPKEVYQQGWARNGAFKNGASYYGYQLPFGEVLGGPLFFDHYSFMGINPLVLSDQYGSYRDQAIHHAKINFEYCKANPKSYFGYSENCWGLTASDIKGGYSASSPTNDLGVIAPTAAVASLPFTPAESMAAINFFYYQMGDKIWGEYGFVDAFNLHHIWFADSFLAIDQGPQIVMIENYRTGLLWRLFMSAPEIDKGLRSLGFTIASN